VVDDLASIAARHEGAPEPAWLWDAERRRILWANAAALTLFGAGSLFDLIDYAFAPDAPEARAAARTGEGIAAALAPMGAPLDAVVNVSAIHLPHAKTARLVVVTQLHPPPEDPALARRASLFEYAPVALILCNLDGAIVEANAAAAIVNGARLNHIGDLVGEAEAKRLVSRALAAGHASAAAERHGRILRAAALRLADPTEGGAAVLVRIEDVTARRDLEALMSTRTSAASAPIHEPTHAGPDPERLIGAVREAEAARDEAVRKSDAKSDFIAKLSHEMRNPLNAIIGFSEIMQQRHFGPLGDKHYETYADDIRASADHLLSLVDDLLDLARIESGRLKLEFESVALGPLIAECVRLLRPAAAGYNVALTADIAALAPVVADARALRQVLINLISNALKFTGAGGEVRVAAAAEPSGAIAVTVADTGVGMSEGEMQLALEPFGQVEGEHQKNRKGTGLGLPLAKALAEANKCGFAIVSEPQRGTRVTITFPPTRVLAG